MKFIRLLKHELAGEARDWVKQGIIQESQAQDILKLYGAEYSSLRGKSLAYSALLCLAALFMGLAVILLVSHNWEDLPRALRMGALLILTLAANGMGIYFFRKQRRALATMWLMLGSILYGASIFLIAQIYHLGEYFPDGIFYWAAGVAPVALLAQSISLMLLSLVLGTIWFVVETSYSTFPWLYGLFCIASLWFCLREKRSLMVFLLSVAGSIMLGEVALSHLLSHDIYGVALDANHVFFTCGIFLALFSLGGYLEQRRISHDLIDYGLVLRLWSMRFGLLSLLIFSFKEPWEELLEASSIHPGFTVAWALAICASVVWLLLRTPQMPESSSLSHLVPSLSFTAAFVIASVSACLPGEADSLAALFQLLTNIGLLSTGIWLITRAMRTSAGSSFHFGVAIILITALLRYFDLIGDYIGCSVLFFISGVVMIVSAKMWKNRSIIQEEVS